MKEIKDNKNVRIHLRSGIDFKMPRVIIAHMDLPDVFIKGHYVSKNSKINFKKQQFSDLVCRFTIKDVPFKKKEMVV